MKHVTMSVDFGLQVEWTGILDDIETSVKYKFVKMTYMIL